MDAGARLVLHALNPKLPHVHVHLPNPNVLFRFGRHQDCDAPYPNEMRISVFHAHLRLLSDQQTVVIADTSVNGTFVNGERVQRNGERALTSGDEIFFVIPNQEMLTQSGYVGSLLGGFVGYIFAHEADAERVLAGRFGTEYAAAAIAAGAPLRSSSLEAGAADDEQRLSQVQLATRETFDSAASNESPHCGDGSSSFPSFTQRLVRNVAHNLAKQELGETVLMGAGDGGGGVARGDVWTGGSSMLGSVRDEAVPTSFATWWHRVHSSRVFDPYDKR